jgi:long-subunit fatty acid transport protein
MTTLDIQPSIAYRIFDRLSVGVSLNIQYASERSTEAIDFGEITQVQALAPFFQGVSNQLAALLAARGLPPALIQQSVTQTVGAIQQAYARAGFVPQGRDGVSEFSGHGWNLGFTVGAIFEYLKGNENCFFQDGRIGFSYRSGITHNLAGHVQFRGFSYDKTPVRSPQFNNLDIPDNDRYLVTAGLRWSPTPKLDFDLGYGHLFEQDPVINVTDSQVHNVRGTATAGAEIISAAVTLKWGGPKESLVSNAPSGKSVGEYSK